MTFSGTLFHVDWTDIQVAGLTPFSAEPITLNGGGAVSRGGGTRGKRQPDERVAAPRVVVVHRCEAEP